MPQIANQDYNVIEIENLDQLTTAEKQQLRDAIERNIIYDCIIKTDGSTTRVVSVMFDAENYWVVVYNAGMGELSQVELSE